MLDPPDAVEITDRVEKLSGEGNTSKAIATAEDFLKANADPDGRLRLTLARIYTEAGDPPKALRHLAQAGRERADGGQADASHRSAASAVAGDAAASVGPHGIEVRAGGVTASIKE